MRRLLLGTLVVSSLGLGAAASAEPAPAQIEGVEFPRSYLAQGVPLKLHSVGVLRWFFLKGYVAGLYLGLDARPQDVLQDLPKRLELHYFYAIQGSDFGPAAWRVMVRILDRPALERIRERADRLSEAYQDVKPGDRYSLTYLPGVGTQLALNGKLKTTIPGADFAAAYFGVWLGSDPIDVPLRDQLLALERANAR